MLSVNASVWKPEERICECCIRALLQAGTLNMQCCRGDSSITSSYFLGIFLFNLVLNFFCLFPFFSLLQLFVSVYGFVVLQCFV